MRCFIFDIIYKGHVQYAEQQSSRSVRVTAAWDTFFLGRRLPACDHNPSNGSSDLPGVLRLRRIVLAGMSAEKLAWSLQVSRRIRIPPQA